MGKINMGRVILGGIVAGIVADILGYLVDGVLLAQRWADGMARLGHGNFTNAQIVWFNIFGLVGGLFAVWFYAAIRPRFGAGMKTAICAGVAVWFIGTLIPNASFMWAAAIFPNHLTLYTTLGALVEVTVGTVVGAALYKEE
jgi:hypothetical protein